MSAPIVTGFLVVRAPLRIVCAFCIRDHHDQSHPLLSSEGKTQLSLRCDECLRYVRTDLDFAHRKVS